MTSDTPRTDDEAFDLTSRDLENGMDGRGLVDADFARQLERELNAAKEQVLLHAQKTLLLAEQLERAEAERDALLETQRKFGTMMHELMNERDALNRALQDKEKCSYMGPMRDCPTHGESEELKAVKAEREHFFQYSGRLLEQLNTLTEERNALREDAERYRYAKEHLVMGKTTDYILERWDEAAIDAARKGETK